MENYLFFFISLQFIALFRGLSLQKISRTIIHDRRCAIFDVCNNDIDYDQIHPPNLDFTQAQYAHEIHFPQCHLQALPERARPLLLR